MEVKGFKAYRFNNEVVGDASECISPPYDVIGPAEQDKLYGRNEYNIVRIIKGKTTDSDTDSDNQYTRAAEFLNSWIAKGALKEDSEDAIYAYIQNFEIAGQAFERFSFIALAKLEPFGKIVRPHERVLNNPIADRLALNRATEAKFGLVFMLYDDNEKIADRIVENAGKGQSLVELTDDQDVRHRLYAITDKADIEAISKMMKDKSCTVADGHHRYTTGLHYAKENPKPSAQYQMIGFSNIRHEGLIVLATHRVVKNLENFDMDKLLNGLKENFEITEYAFDSSGSGDDAKAKMIEKMKEQFAKDGNAFGIYAGTNVFYAATLNDTSAMDKAVPQMSDAWKSLDVAVLHKLILEGLLGIDDEKLAGGEYVEYVKDSGDKIDELISEVDAGKKQAAFFMNPPKLEQIQAVADAGERMPQKATYFFPKLFTGLTINKL